MRTGIQSATGHAPLSLKQLAGFRCSPGDALVLGLAVAAAAYLASAEMPMWWLIPMVVGHFFLFCNVFRVRRWLELVWAGVFVLVAGGWMAVGRIDWLPVFLTQLPCTLAVLAAEVRSPSYHGIAAARLNPHLGAWMSDRLSGLPRGASAEADASLHAALEGCLLGGAVGDALGLPAEGLHPDRIRRRWSGQWRMRLLPGRGLCSDDAEHAFAVAASLAEHPDDVEAFRKALAGRLRRWFLSLPAGMGMATARACLRLCCGMSPTRSGVRSAGNGPAMRSAIIGVRFRHDPVRRREYVRASALMTHTDSRAEAGAQAVAAAAACAATGGDRRALLSELETLSDVPEWRDAMRLLRKHGAPGHGTAAFAGELGLTDGVTGYMLHTVPVALQAWLAHPDDFRAALISGLDCGGDTDTVGAIIGGICGAGSGTQGIPDEWLSGLRDWPLTRGRLETAAAAMVGVAPVPRVPWLAQLARNCCFLLIVLGHGARRLLP